ncbi:MAG: hypothetical protein WCC38_17445, partial [Pseudonocardiaceae bacterium]
MLEGRAPRRHTGLDLQRAALLAVALATLTLVIVKGQDWSWAFTAASLVVAVVSTTLLGRFDLGPEGDGTAGVPAEPPRRDRPLPAPTAAKRRRPPRCGRCR